jgi:hypothetical protein
MDDSSKDGEGFNDNERSPGRGLGVNVGVGKPWVMLARFSGVRDKGRRFKVAGRGLEGVGFVIATAGVVVMGDIFSFIESIDKGGCNSCALLKPIGGSSSSSSSSSSTRVWSWSLLDEDGPRSLKESRLLLVKGLRLLP